MSQVWIDVPLHNLHLFIGIGCLIILAVLARYRRPECPECAHCRQRRHEEAEAQRKAQDDYWGKR